MVIQMIVSGDRVQALVEDGSLVAAVPEVRGWWVDGAPSLSPSGFPEIVESPTRVPRSSDVFWVAVDEALDERGWEVVEVDRVKKALTTPQETAVGGGQQVFPVEAAGSPSSVNLQLRLPPKPNNAHDVARVRDYLWGAQASRDVVVRRDPMIYEIDAGIDWVFPLTDDAGQIKNILVPGETDTRAGEYRPVVARVSRQLRHVPGNVVETRDPKGHWYPVQRTGFPVRPEPGPQDSDRILETRVINDDEDETS